MSVDGSSITREDLENFYTACESNRTVPDCINKAFVNVSQSILNSFASFVKLLTSLSSIPAFNFWNISMTKVVELTFSYNFKSYCLKFDIEGIIIMMNP